MKFRPQHFALSSGVKAIQITSVADVQPAVRQPYTHIFTSPELLVEIQMEINSLPSDSILRKKFKFVFVDESQCGNMVSSQCFRLFCVDILLWS